ncbi:MAG TPA: 2-dehydropantoate 2-reductase [Polyangiaceae bacterium]|jgi:2-dehydropantoate 2-reductase
MKLLVMGCGGIGGIVTAALAETGHDVVAYTTNVDIAGAVERNGLQIRGDGAGRGVRVRLAREVPRESFDAVLLCTQPPQVEDAARAALPVLAEHGVMVCLQNGLCEPRVAKICGESRTVGAVVAWGAAMPEPGVYERTAHGGFAIGTLETRRDLGELARALEAIGPVEVTDNLAGKRWSKLAINAAISSLGTIGGDRLGAIMQHRFVRRLALEIMTECVHVARKEDVHLEKVSGTVDLEWLALTAEEKVVSGSPSLIAKHAMLLAVGFRYRRMRSSMLAAIERGRTPAVEFLNGEIVDRGRAHGVPVSVNDAARAMVWSIAKGERKSGVDTLRELARTTAV